jgi:hypothetical protein
MRAVIRWFRTPLPLKFWIYSGLATPFVLLGTMAVIRGVQVELDDPVPLSHGLRYEVWIVICFALGGVFIWRAIRAYRGRS